MGVFIMVRGKTKEPLSRADQRANTFWLPKLLACFAITAAVQLL